LKLKECITLKRSCIYISPPIKPNFKALYFNLMVVVFFDWKDKYQTLKFSIFSIKKLFIRISNPRPLIHSMLFFTTRSKIDPQFNDNSVNVLVITLSSELYQLRQLFFFSFSGHFVCCVGYPIRVNLYIFIWNNRKRKGE
jgi:hypothetical protein